MNRAISRLRARFRVRWTALIPAWLILVSGSWVADGLKGEVLFGEWKWARSLAGWSGWSAVPEVFGRLVGWIDFQLVGLFVAVSCFVGTSFWLYSYRRDFAQVRTLSQSPCTPHRSLILLVSIPRPVPECHGDAVRVPDGRDGHVPLDGPLDDDIERFTVHGVRWNWQQLLRGIKPHLPGLERVWLVGSGPAGTGSFKHLTMCDTVLRKYLSSDTAVMRHPDAVNFEDFNGLSRCLRQIIRKEQEEGMREEDIVVDITGGQKTTSIAGAGITLSTEVTFQYVQTGAPFEVYAYDVVQHFPKEQ